MLVSNMRMPLSSTTITANRWSVVLRQSVKVGRPGVLVRDTACTCSGDSQEVPGPRVEVVEQDTGSLSKLSRTLPVCSVMWIE